LIKKHEGGKNYSYPSLSDAKFVRG